MQTKYVVPALFLFAMNVAIAAPTPKQLQALKRAVVEDFKDPASAQFRKIERVDQATPQTNKTGEGIYCGEVNAKNSYGGYTGFMPFIGAIVGDGAMVINVAQDDDSVTVVHELCRRARAGELGE